MNTAILQRVLRQPQNRRVLEQMLHRVIPDDALDDALYELVYILTSQTSPINRQTLQNLLHCLYNQEFIWNHSVFDEIRMYIEEEDAFIIHPFTVEEGILECMRCGSMRTFSYQKQIRSADEGATTFAQCVDCKHRWRHHN